MWTVSGGVTSRPLERLDRLYPESVSGINATRITDTGKNLYGLYTLNNCIKEKTIAEYKKNYSKFVFETF